MTTLQEFTAFDAFQHQLKTLCLQEFPCGNGKWRENHGKRRNILKLEKVKSHFTVTLKDYGAQYEKTETLEELVHNKTSPWNLDYSWSNEAKDLREIAVRSPWLIDHKFILNHFKTLKIVDKGVTEINTEFLKFENLEELTLSANHIQSINSSHLPKKLKVLELCANQISSMADLCQQPPPLCHLGLGFNNLHLVDDYISANYWPHLLSLDLSHNNLCDLMEIIRKLQTLPKLRNLVLYGNPLALLPGYRGYTIDSLKNLSFLDDINISADERHRYKGLAKRKEYILDEAKVTLHVSYIKGIPMPEEIKNPNEQPEYPVVTRKYFIQFMYLEDKSADAEIFQILHDGFSSMASPTIESMTDRSQSQAGETEDTEHSIAQDHMRHEVMEHSPCYEPSQARSAQDIEGTAEVSDEKARSSSPAKADAAVASFKLAPINSGTCVWAEKMDIDWTQVITRDDLLALRDFFKQGMEIHVIEEKILSYPADQMQDGGVPSPPATPNSKAKKTDKKDEKSPVKKPADDKKKKGKKEEIEIVDLPPELTTLATFNIQLAQFLDNDYEYENTFSHDWQQKNEPVLPEQSEASIKKDAGKKKDKVKSGSAKSGKKDKDVRKSPKPGAGKDKKDDKHLTEKASKVKTAVHEAGDEDVPPPPPLEFHIRIQLQHWKTAMDSRTDEVHAAQQ